MSFGRRNSRCWALLHPFPVVDEGPLPGGCELVTFNDDGLKLDGDALVAFLRGHDKAITALEVVDAHVLSQLPDLTTISKYGVGLDTIDQQAMQLASRVVRAVEEVTAQEGVNWQTPEIGPVPDGSVAVTWEGSHRDTLMVFRPGQATGVEWRCPARAGRAARALERRS